MVTACGYVLRNATHHRKLKDGLFNVSLTYENLHSTIFFGIDKTLAGIGHTPSVITTTLLLPIMFSTTDINIAESMFVCCLLFLLCILFPN